MKNQVYKILITAFLGLPSLSVTSQMPVELSEFNVHSDMSVNVLYWETASEINNNYFLLEKSQDAICYESIERIEGNGNSNEIKTYYASDENPFSTTYYRLKQVDFDGNFRYYGPITITNNNLVEFSMYNLYPNPAAEVFFIDMFVKNQSTINLFIYDPSGNVAYSSQTNGSGKQILEIDAVSWSSGIYVLTVTNRENDILSTQRIVIK